MANKLPHNRGTTLTITGTHLDANDDPVDLTGATVRFTVKTTEYDSDTDDSTALISKDVTVFTSPTDGEYTITVDPADTQTITPGTYFYDIKVELASGVVHELAEGRYVLDGGPTNRLS